MKVSSKSLIAILFLSVSAQLFSMKFEQLKAQAYFRECREIDEKNEKKLNNFIDCAYGTNPTKQMDNIKRELEGLQQEMDKRKEDSLLAIKKKYNVSDESWSLRMQVAQQLKDFEEENKKFPLPNVNHDSKIPYGIMCMLKQNLINNGINPERYNIKLRKEDGKRVEPTQLYVHLKDQITSICITGPGYIVVDLFKENFSLAAQEGLCSILVNMISELRSYLYTIGALISLNEIYSDQHKIYIEKADEKVFRKLATVLPALCSALKSAYDATIIKAFYKEAHIPDFSIDDYKQLSKIDNLHRSLAGLERYAICKVEKPIIMNNTENTATEEQTKETK